MSSKRNSKSRPNAPANTPGAVSVPFEEVKVEEPSEYASFRGQLPSGSENDQKKEDNAAKAAGRRSARAINPGVTSVDAHYPRVEDATMEPSPQKLAKSKSDHKSKRTTAAITPGAVSMAHDDPGAINAKARKSKGPQQEPELTDEMPRQHGKSRSKPARSPGVMRVEQKASDFTLSYGMSKPAALSNEEALITGPVPVALMEPTYTPASQGGKERTNVRTSSKSGKIATPPATCPGAQSMSGNQTEDQDDAEYRKDPRVRSRRRVEVDKVNSVGRGVGSNVGADGTTTKQESYKKKRLDEKIKQMEDEMTPTGNDERQNEGGVLRFRDGDKKHSLKGDDDEAPTMGLLPPHEAPAPISTTADRGIYGAPDVIGGTRGAGYGAGGYGGHDGLYGDMPDEGLAVAIAVDEDEEELFFPSAVEFDPDAKPPLLKNRRFRVYFIGCILLFVVLVVGVIVGVRAVQGSGSNTYAPTRSPTTSPSTSQEGIYREQFAAVVGDAVMLEGTPHEKAANWIIFEDPMNLSSDAPNLIQRYMAALFYFSTTDNGRRGWRTCNPPVDSEDATCLYDRIQRNDNDDLEYVAENAIRWLSSEHECSWSGNFCDDTSTMRVIENPGQNISGTLPTELAKLTTLQSISLYYNEFTGTIPTEYAGMKLLLNLELHGNFLTGSIADDWFTVDSLQSFNLGGNMLSGPLQTRIGLLTNLKGLHLFDNMLSGDLPSEIGNLQFLSFTRLSGNNFNGTIPTEIGRLSLLQEFWMSNNTFTGTIPNEIGAMTTLGDLRFGGNALTGTIPEVIYNFTLLWRLEIEGERINGTISTNIGNLRLLEILHLRETLLTGTIPTQLGLCTALKLAWLHRTLLSGSMPLEVCANKGGEFLEFLQTDCNPDSSPAVACAEGCCSACCDRSTDICLKV